MEMGKSNAASQAPHSCTRDVCGDPRRATCVALHCRSRFPQNPGVFQVRQRCRATPPLKNHVVPVALQLSGVSHVKLPLKRCRATRGCSSCTSLAGVALHCDTFLSDSFGWSPFAPGEFRAGGPKSETNARKIGKNAQIEFQAVFPFFGKDPWGHSACTDRPDFLVLGAAPAPASIFVSEPQIVPLASILLHGPLDSYLDLLPAAPLPPVQNRDAQHKFLRFGTVCNGAGPI